MSVSCTQWPTVDAALAEAETDARASVSPCRVSSSLAEQACAVRRLAQVIEKIGAGEGNRTLVISLEGFCSTIELHPRRRPRPLHIAFAPVGKNVRVRVPNGGQWNAR